LPQVKVDVARPNDQEAPGHKRCGCCPSSSLSVAWRSNLQGVPYRIDRHTSYSARVHKSDDRRITERLSTRMDWRSMFSGNSWIALARSITSRIHEVTTAAIVTGSVASCNSGRSGNCRVHREGSRSRFFDAQYNLRAVPYEPIGERRRAMVRCRSRSIPRSANSVVPYTSNAVA
jgi:hypothetical protein